MDTDSIIYRHRRNRDPLPAGEGHFGELTDETPDHEIIEYVCGGCKNYALLLRNKETDELEHQIKVRGLTLDWMSSQRLHFENFKYLVLNYGAEPATFTEFEGPMAESIPEHVAKTFPPPYCFYKPLQLIKHLDKQHLALCCRDNPTEKTYRQWIYNAWHTTTEEEFHAFSALVAPICLTYPKDIKRDKFGHVWSSERSKNYRAIVQKGIVDDNFNVLPFGFNGTVRAEKIVCSPPTVTCPPLSSSLLSSAAYSSSDSNECSLENRNLAIICLNPLWNSSSKQILN